MHYACMIVGPDPERQLEPYADHREVPRYKHFYEPPDIKLMAEHFSLPESDLQALASKMPEWEEAEGGVENGRLFRWSTANPNSKYDWYELGGRFDGYLGLKQPVQPSAWRRLLGASPKDRVNQARKAEVTVDPIHADPPAALLVAGSWHECPITSDATALEAWRQDFVKLFTPVPDDALLTIMDMHS